MSNGQHHQTRKRNTSPQQRLRGGKRRTHRNPRGNKSRSSSMARKIDPHPRHHEGPHPEHTGRRLAEPAGPENWTKKRLHQNCLSNSGSSQSNLWRPYWQTNPRHQQKIFPVPTSLSKWLGRGELANSNPLPTPRNLELGHRNGIHPCSLCNGFITDVFISNKQTPTIYPL